MLEAKAKDQGHKRQCSPKKKGLYKNFLSDFQKKKKKKKKKVFTKIFQAISTKKRFPKKFSSASQNFNNSKNSAVLEPRTGQFSRTWGLEAKAKDLTFETKAKDFKMCPRGIHLCWVGGTPKLCQNDCLLNIYWYQKKSRTLAWAVQKIDFGVVHLGGFPGEGGWHLQTVSKYLSVEYPLTSKQTSTLAWAVQKIDFLGPHFRGVAGGVAPKTFRRKNCCCSSTTLHKN